MWFCIFVSRMIFQSTCLREARPPGKGDCIKVYGFQSTCLREARHETRRFSVTPSPDFNPRAYARHDETPAAGEQPAGIFQSTCLREARRHRPPAMLQMQISIHVPTRGTTAIKGVDSIESVFQSTCLREARLKPDTARPQCYISIHVPTRGTTSARPQARSPRNISIHVPTRGTTPFRNSIAPISSISIHVPTRGTTSPPWRSPGSMNFNPRAYARHDPPSPLSGSSPEISIHVPTRGTTSTSPPIPGIPYFNPRAYARHDIPDSPALCLLLDFNPRAYARHDAIATVAIGAVLKFQSTCLREARHRPADRRCVRRRISIHVPTRGTTHRSGPSGCLYPISIHVPTRGTTARAPA